MRVIQSKLQRETQIFSKPGRARADPRSAFGIESQAEYQTRGSIYVFPLTVPSGFMEGSVFSLCTCIFFSQGLMYSVIKFSTLKLK